MTNAVQRWLSASEAARYVGMETEGFRRAVRRGTLPGASYVLGKQSPRWDRVALDRIMGGEDVNGMEEIFSALVQSPQEQTKDRAKAPGRREHQGL